MSGSRVNLWRTVPRDGGRTDDLLARVVLFYRLTGLAADLATPDEPAVAPLHPANLFHLVSASTAQRLAAFRAVRPSLTPPSPRPGHPAVGVRSTVVRRPVDEDQFRVGDRLAPFAFLPPAQGGTSTGREDGRPAARVERPGCGRRGPPAPRPRRYLHRVLVLGFELVPDLAERRDGSPARLDSTRSGHAVTTTLHLHQRRQHLHQQQQQQQITWELQLLKDGQLVKAKEREGRVFI